MSFRNCCLGLLVASAFALPTNAKAQDDGGCELRFAERSATITLLAANVGYGQTASDDQEIKVVNAVASDGSATCRANVRLSRLTSNRTFPDYRISSAGRTLQPSLSQAEGGGKNQLVLNVPASRAGRNIALRVVAPTNWGIRAGRHVERLQLSLVGPTGEIIDRMALSLILDIPKTVDVMFVGATGIGRATSINLGALSQTEVTKSPTFGVRIWSTSGYSFGFSSEHGGQLEHELGMDSIPYNLNMNGRQIALDGSTTPVNMLAKTARRGDFYRLNLSVPGRRSVAGRYQDRIVVSVSAL